MALPLRWIVIAVLGCLLLGWWLSNPAPTLPIPDNTRIADITRADTSACPLPPLVARGAAPLQSEIPSAMPALSMEGATLQPLAGFSIEARVLGREDYRIGREAEFSPTDLALGWGRMTEDAVLAQLKISQGGRWYRYSWKHEPPIPLGEIIRSSANMHMLPADDRVAAALGDVEAGERVRIDGWLVQVNSPDGWRWRSSLTREDSGGGACEVVYVCSITRQ
ncbi:hypothetical protein [Thermomonas carbonis]|uniref:Uncharacterized protein n=1 Tax=Thermomonas carbonis TaxID=1463158 RepID=A0A7G9SLX5_9GAMM|nr:hypothetical protein [Thermomonas carbonis]QNN68850.1 hypothetical protein H9L16_08860 [Thermomonas carbonis]GHC08318.1 hypothetical protein GCM10010080_24050 [Thermomonas carbonis]